MECRVLSIQSHVVRGYVGNKSASFPLQVSIVHPRRATAGAARCTRDYRCVVVHDSVLVLEKGKVTWSILPRMLFLCNLRFM